MTKSVFDSRDHNDIDVNAVYHQLVATYTSDSDENPQPGTSTGAATPAGRRRFVHCYFSALHVLNEHFI